MGERMGKVVRPIGLAFTAGTAALSGLSCGGGDSIEPPATGRLEVTTITTGPELDAEGYGVSIDGGAETPLGANASLQRDNLETGNHSVQLIGIAENCTVDGQNPRSVTVSGGAKAAVTFTVVCRGTTGGLQITTTTTGPSPDADGYTVSVDGGAPQLIDINSTITMSSLAPGAHSVALAGLVANCSVQGNNPQSVSIVAGASATAAFTIVCHIPGVTRWTAMMSGTTSTLTDLSGSSANSIFVVSGSSTIRHYDGTSWSPQPAPAGVRTVWANSSTDAFAVGDSKLGVFLHYDGRQWSSIPPPAHYSCGEDLYSEWIAAIWGSSEADVFAVGGFECEGHAGGPYIAHYDGTAWSRKEIAQDVGELALSDVWGSSAGDVYAVGTYSPSTPGEYDPDEDEAVIIHYDGSEWLRAVSGPFLRLEHIWASSPSDAYATGWTVQPGGNAGVGSLWHFDGRSWSAIASPTTAPLGAIWGSSATDVYIVASDKTIWHFDGAGWAKAHTSGSALHAIWGSSPTDVYAVGDNGTILHGTP